jgi:hypothetical protein
VTYPKTCFKQRSVYSEIREKIDVAIDARRSSLHLFWWTEPLLYVVSFITEVPGFKRVDWRPRCSWDGPSSCSPEQPSGKHRGSESTPKVLIGEAVDNRVHCSIHDDQVMRDEPEGAVAVHNLQASTVRYMLSPRNYLLLSTLNKFSDKHHEQEILLYRCTSDL